jgi:methylmalonyl-CoA/ethylmalonyl-CoA epimerase
MAERPAALDGIAGSLHHVAIVVRSLEESRGAWEALGLTCGEPEFVADQDVNVLVCAIGGQRIELVEPASADSPVSKFLERRGPGLHHLAFEVPDCAAAIAAAALRGLELIDEAPRPGSHGTIIAFLHPRATGGVLTELVEDPFRAAH